MIKKLFLCHPRPAADEVSVLADALRLRGIVPWVDQQGGFHLGDPQIDTARRVIRQECFGLLLYATRDTFESDFIGRVEMNEALGAHDSDPTYQLLALPRRINFRELSRLSLTTFGLDLATFASRTLVSEGVDAEGTVLEALFAELACELLTKRLALDPGTSDSLQLQYSTRDRLADDTNDRLCVDATRLLGSPGATTDAERWERLHQGLRDVKVVISQTLGRPRLQVHGSKHLTAAFLFGYTFPSTAFELDLRVKHGFWATDCPETEDFTMLVDERGGSATSNSLHVEVSTLRQTVANAVRRYAQRTAQSPLATLRLTANPATYGGAMDNAAAVAIADRVHHEIARAVSSRPVEQVHLFASLPQALATIIGQRLNALPPVQLYEYDGQEYHPSYCLH